MKNTLFLEPLENRLLLTGGPGMPGPLLPLYTPSQNPYGTAQPDLPSAEVNGFYSLLLGRSPDAAGQAFWTGALQGGASAADLVHDFVTSPEYLTNLVEAYYQRFLGRAADAEGLDYWTGDLSISSADTIAFTTAFAASAEYQKLTPTNDEFVQSLYANVFGRQGGSSEVEFWSQALAGGASREFVANAITSSTESLTQSVQRFYQTFLQRPTDAGGLSYWVGMAQNEPLSVVLGQILSTTEFQYQAAAGMASKSFDNYFGFNQQTLANDAVTDPVASGSGASAGLVPMDSPWDQAVVFPSVSYSAIETGSAVQPTLQLPADLVSSVNLAQGDTVQFWFQAKSPGVILSTALPTQGDTATGTYTAPLIYINSTGNLVAGLFDQNAISLVPNQSLLSWKDPSGQIQIGAAFPLVSQVGVVDNTWHHVAFALSSQSESLYVDGVLQGTSQPQYHQTNANLTSSSTSLNVPLSQSPSSGQMISGTISQVNPASDTDFGPGGTSQIYSFQGWLPSSGQALLNLTATSGSSAVQSVLYSAANDNTPASLTFQLSGAVASANALTVNASYLTAASAYSLIPSSSSSYSTPVNSTPGPSTKVSFGNPTGLTVGGTIVPEPTSSLYPTTNYPQGFVGAVDEVALWNTQLSQPQVQSAMAGPALSANGSGGILPGNLFGYFPFTQTVSGQSNEWPNKAPGATSIAVGPTTGTILTSVASTIPTDPFVSATRLPGSRDWGLDIMTPLASPSITLPGGETVHYKVGLAAGDQLAITVPEGQQGLLSLLIENDLGQTSDVLQMSPNSTQYLPASRTGTYQLTLIWTAAGDQSTGVVRFGLIPGPLNSLLELFTSYAQGVSPTQTNTVQAYSDPNLPGINTTVGSPNATGSANYWPLWNDPSFFPISNIYTSADLNIAYQKLVKALIAMNVGLSDFANLVGAGVSNPATIQQYLAQSYQNAYGKAPPTANGSNPFTVAAAATPQDAVYEFFYNSNLLRETIYPVLTGSGSSSSPASLPSWIQGVIDGINSSAIPANIATIISTGQTQQVQDITVHIMQPSQKESIGEILAGGAIWAVGGLLAALSSLGGPEAPVAIVLIGSALAGGGASLGQSFADNAFAAGASTQTFTVPVTAITNSELNYETLNSMAVSIQAGAIQQWTNLLSALTNANFAQSVMSNYGLLKAFSAMSGAPLSDGGMNPADSITTSLTRSSWQEMIPATFTWTPVQPYAFPTGNNQTNDIAQTGPYPSGGKFPFVGGLVGADFNNDGKLDMAVAGVDSSDVNILLADGGGGFKLPTQISLLGADGASGIASGDFNHDGNQDLAVANKGTSDVSLLLGNGDGTFKPAQKVSLDGPDGATGIVSADFNGDGKLDLAVTNHSSSDLSILLGNGDGTFQKAQTVSLHGPDGADQIAIGDFDNDGKLDLAVSDFDSDEVSVLFGNGDGTFQTAQTLSLQGPDGAQGIVVGDFNGDKFSDIAVANSNSNNITVLISNGNGGFDDPATYDMPAGADTPRGIALLQTVGGLPNLVVTGYVSNNLVVFFNQGNGGFQTPIIVSETGKGPAGMFVGDFAGNGGNQIAVSNASTNDIVLFDPAGVGNTATFLPSSSTSSTPNNGPTNLQNSVDSRALDKLLTQLEALQGGDTVSMGPFDQRILVTPNNVTPPNFMAYTNLTYPSLFSDPVPLSLNAPGMFLSLTPVTLNETAQNGNKNLSYTQNGAYLDGWQLLDSNGNAIAPATVLQLFGTPSVNSSGQTVGVNLTPVNPNRPFGAFNGGWYFNAQPVAGAAASWADTFFNWGLGTPTYSSRVLTPTAPLEGKLPNTATHDVSNDDISYQVSFQPASDGPPAYKVGVAVDLSSYFNRTGIVSDGTVISSTGGIDGMGNALSGTLVGTSVIGNGAQFMLGTIGVNNVISTAGQTISLPGGSFSTLNLLGAAVNGSQQGLTFTVNYTDGTNQSFSQSMSDWGVGALASGETTAATTIYRDQSAGGKNIATFDLYAYGFTLDKSKSVESITLPNDANVIVAALTLT